MTIRESRANKIQLPQFRLYGAPCAGHVVLLVTLMLIASVLRYTRIYKYCRLLFVLFYLSYEPKHLIFTSESHGNSGDCSIFTILDLLCVFSKVLLTSSP